jgi:hypothetical protein
MSSNSVAEARSRPKAYSLVFGNREAGHSRDPKEAQYSILAGPGRPKPLLCERIGCIVLRQCLQFRYEVFEGSD